MDDESLTVVLIGEVCLYFHVMDCSTLIMNSDIGNAQWPINKIGIRFSKDEIYGDGWLSIQSIEGDIYHSYHVSVINDHTTLVQFFKSHGFTNIDK